MSSRARGYVSHRTTERTRVKVPERRRDDGYFTEAKRSLSQFDGVRHVEVNPLTASILLRHDRGFTLPAEAEMPFDLAGPLVDPATAEPQQQPLMAGVRRDFARANARLMALTGGALDFPSMAFVALLAVAGVQLVRGNVGAPVVTLMWYASEVARLGSGGTRQPACGQGGSAPA